MCVTPPLEMIFYNILFKGGMSTSLSCTIANLKHFPLEHDLKVITFPLNVYTFIKDFSVVSPYIKNFCVTQR